MELWLASSLGKGQIDNLERVVRVIKTAGGFGFFPKMLVGFLCVTLQVALMDSISKTKNL